MIQPVLLYYFCNTLFKRRKLVQFQEDQKQHDEK